MTTTTSYLDFLLDLHALLHRQRIATSVPFVWAGLGEDVASDEVLPLRMLVGDIVTFIDEHPGAVEDLDFLSDHAHRSKYHFARIFREETGMAPWAYVQEARLRKAKELLEHTDLPLAEIALEAGFYDQSHFSRTFKQAEGTTPGQYRKDLQERDEQDT